MTLDEIKIKTQSDEYEKRLDYAKANTSLPDEPNYEAINELVMSVNERVVTCSF